MKGEDVTLDIQGDDLANMLPSFTLFPSTRLTGSKVIWSTMGKCGHSPIFLVGWAVATYREHSGGYCAEASLDEG